MLHGIGTSHIHGPGAETGTDRLFILNPRQILRAAGWMMPKIFIGALTAIVYFTAFVTALEHCSPFKKRWFHYDTVIFFAFARCFEASLAFSLRKVLESCKDHIRFMGKRSLFSIRDSFWRLWICHDNTCRYDMQLKYAHNTGLKSNLVYQLPDFFQPWIAHTIPPILVLSWLFCVRPNYFDQLKNLEMKFFY